MATNKRPSATISTIVYLLIIALIVGYANSARILLDDAPAPLPEADDVPPGPDEEVVASAPPAPLPEADVPSGPDEEVAPAVAPEASIPVTTPSVPIPAITTSTAPAEAPTSTTPLVDVPSVPVSSNAVTTPVANAAPSAGPTAAAVSFYMHDILGGSQPSGRVVAGIVANMGVNSQLPFSRPNTAVLPINGGVPLLNNGNNINGLLNNNNIPYLAGLGGASRTTLIGNSGNNAAVEGGNELPFVNAQDLPAGNTLQQLMFGTITVIDDELTEGEELGSSVVGKAQGFYLSSSVDGTSHTMAVTALFHGDGHVADDTISFFGVHRTAVPESQVAVVGGTGKYENAKGYANVQTLHPSGDPTTDGVETLHQFSVYLSY